jgi:acyl-CoA synthetase (AMP-forming)/AMP-acid ligase II
VNQTSAGPPAQDVLEISTKQRTEALDLVSSQLRLTYHQLDVAASRFAQALRAHGIPRQDRIAILLDNSVEVVVPTFGTLKAGAVFRVFHPATRRATGSRGFSRTPRRPRWLLTASACVTARTCWACPAPAVHRA